MPIIDPARKPKSSYLLLFWPGAVREVSTGSGSVGLSNGVGVGVGASLLLSVSAKTFILARNVNVASRLLAFQGYSCAVSRRCGSHAPRSRCHRR